MVIRGDLQVPTEKDTYAATLAMRVSRAIHAICAYFDVEAHQFDVTNAFPQVELDKDDIVIINYPDALYGLSISLKLWYNHLKNTLEKIGLKSVPESGCVFCNDELTVCFYVHDIAVFYHMRSKYYFEQFKKILFEVYAVKDMGAIKLFLELRIVRNRSERKLWLVQDSYIEKMAQTFKRIDNKGNLIAKNVEIPMKTDKIKSWDGKATDHQIFMSRPDIAKATQKLAEVQQNLSQEHFEAVNRVIDYLYTTRYLAIEYGISEKGPVFIAASDASFGDNMPERTSSEGGIFKLFG
ncbi:Retrovirus-related Pol polyprotein from transposon TNT 1-94, partial [Golovinomyces cichoracearum]